jgi:hypothetical protein
MPSSPLQNWLPYRFFYGTLGAGTYTWDSPISCDVVISAFTVQNEDSAGTNIVELADQDGVVFIRAYVDAAAPGDGPNYTFTGVMSLGQLSGLQVLVQEDSAFVVVSGYLVVPQTYAVLPS